MNVAVQAGTRHFALIGTPNSGKTALFNALTGSRQKVANYPGVTVERKTGVLHTPSGRSVSLVDLPGTYSLRARSPDEEVTRDVVLGRFASGDAAGPAALRRRRHQSAPGLAAGDRAQTRRAAAAARAQHDRHRTPARRRDRSRALSAELGVPVITAAAVRRGGIDDLMRRLDALAADELKATQRDRLAAADHRRTARRPARGRPHHQARRPHAGQAGHADHAARCRAAASGRRPRHPARPAVRDVPGGVHLGAAADGPDLGGVRRARRAGARHAAGRAAAELHRRTASFPASAA